MASIQKDTTINKYQDFIREIYGLNNDRYFSVGDMLTQIQRFAMRGLKGIRKADRNKIKTNLLISLSWFMSLVNQLHIKTEEEIWKRFPYLCSYCASCPCCCKEKHLKERQKVFIDENKRPKTLEEFQNMFKKIYPPESRSQEDAGIHLAEELGEFSEAILTYLGQHRDADFENIALEAADLFSCFMGVFNSAGINLAEELSLMFSENCHDCKKSPCQCSFLDIMGFKS
jgi:NTP pyrophosphatase (non-canonical NTP hydrolase)